jgi:hypothetical protein
MLLQLDLKAAVHPVETAAIISVDMIRARLAVAWIAALAKISTPQLFGNNLRC